MLNWFMKYFGDPVDVRIDRPKLHLTKIAVHLYDGRTIVHYSSHYQIFQDGRLKLFNKMEDEEDFVAFYPQGSFMSVSTGKRQIANYGTDNLGKKSCPVDV